ncbi:MAG: exodeoxyribonuclease VII small subunit [Sporanaerobacter sp.]|jgi:exodeoxyribonuclease VII small subunit|uniref:exodeoxyribonuclease VII small subunit n=1 Tax=Sporanaerobacter sp. TaxID=2010183 RepID=UPI003A100166
MNLNNMPYEEGVKKLEEIIDKLENEDLSLEEAFNYFKNGIELYQYLSKKLNKVEGEIKIILKDEKGVEIEENFQMEG